MPDDVRERRPEVKIGRIVLACAVLACGSAAAQKECTRAESAAAEKATDRIVNYGQLSKAYKDYRHCNAGVVEENFTDAILRLLVAWKDVDTVASDLQSDPEYKKFIHRHLTSPAAKDDRPSIYSRAKSSCPPIQDEFCKELMEVVKDPARAAPAPAPAPAAAPKAPAAK